MLQHAPTAAGKRYVAIALHIAHQKGEEAVVNLARTWLQSLFLRMMALGIKDAHVQPSSSQTPTLHRTEEQTESSTRSDLKTCLQQREQHRCAITRAFDSARGFELMRSQDIPPGSSFQYMAAAHIIPFVLDDFRDDNSHEVVRDIVILRVLFRLLLTCNIHRHRLRPLPRKFPDVPNKHTTRMLAQGHLFSNGQGSADVEFRALPGIEAPDPELLRIHAAFAQVLHLCGAADFMNEHYRFDEGDVTLFMHPTEDFGRQLSARLAVLAF
ncbi:uncharacterized protein B0H18DRAFT_1022933 [Fomitopsis serialis]|uniref:uncharacterized protein n=1 Tax=Fomitopsis serialis TaxID=139415 RepID=UPI0020080E2D|nr:uncharacterized protein B0H18DRAFT_1022933 [Neoantrodia serialis]KAH9920956.1 hypothetical protein B0H18DRAFT_1022933 [Neoantrodia serialis]